MFDKTGAVRVACWAAPPESEMIAILEFLAITSFILTCLLWLVAAA